MMIGNLKPVTRNVQPMAIRIQPPEFEISAENPFEHDLLERAESIKALTTMIGAIEGPCVMAVDASWGMGKTTFPACGPNTFATSNSRWSSSTPGKPTSPKIHSSRSRRRSRPDSKASGARQGAWEDNDCAQQPHPWPGPHLARPPE